MDKIRIIGGNMLNGTIPVSGAKNATLPLMCATLLTEETLTLENVPDLADIKTLIRLLGSLGTHVEIDGDATAKADIGRVIHFTSADINNPIAHYDLVKQMRASVLVLGPMLARLGHAKVSLPGGCAIGARPVDLHIDGLTAMGANITIEDGYIVASAPEGLKGCKFHFPKVSVGATENLMMAASLAKGETVLTNVAREPEIVDLGQCLMAMGAKIEGLGTDKLTIQGVEKLHGAHHRVVCDRIEAGTYAIAVAMTGGEVLLKGANMCLFKATAEKLKEAGVTLKQEENGLRVSRDPKVPLKPFDAMTEPFPGFATDLQAQMMTLLCIAEGAGMITETIFENRFMHVPELMRLGANITIHNSSALVRGVKQLKGAPVMATDLRASVSLVLAGLVANGETTVDRIYHLDRGYERIEEKLRACGANIERIHG